MWRNVYRLPDGSYEFGEPWAWRVLAVYNRAPAPGVVCVGIVRERRRIEA